MFSERTIITLAELLLTLVRKPLPTLLAKYEIAVADGFFGIGRDVETIRAALPLDDPDRLSPILGEIKRRREDFRSQTSPRWRFDVRWNELMLCLRLDGYELTDDGLKELEPAIAGQQPIEDDLSVQLEASMIPSAEEIRRLIGLSATHFTGTTPDYNACLADIRVALETLVKDIADARKTQDLGNSNPKKWGEVVAYLRKTNFITEEEEKGIAGVYGFLSLGAHRPATDEDQREMARLGRNMALGMCYFLIRQFNKP